MTGQHLAIKKEGDGSNVPSRKTGWGEEKEEMTARTFEKAIWERTDLKER